jgi:hypothetical protein
MSEWIIAFVTIFGTVASVSGVVAYVFNGTRSLIREMHATTEAIYATAKEMHATLIEIHKEGERRHQEVMETLKQQHQDHQDIVELLKKGFGVAAT